MVTERKSSSPIRQPLAQPRAIPLRFVLIVPFLLQILAVVGLTGYFSWRNGQKTVESMAIRLGEEVTAHIEKHVDGYTNTPSLFLEVNQAAIETGNLDINDFDRLFRYFWQQTQLSEAVPYVYFANPQGEFVGVWRQSEELTTFRLRTEATAPNREVYQLNSLGESVELLNNDEYDPRSRPWYQTALKSGQPTWSPIYVFSQPLSLGFTRVFPLYNKDDDLLGVMAADITLTDVSEFLQQIQVSDSGQVFIIEHSGEIVASSAEEPPFVTTESGEKRLAAVQSNNHLIQGTANQLLQQFEDFDQINSAQQLTLNIDGQRQFVEVTPITGQLGIDWLMVVIVPEADFTAHIQENNRTTLLLCLAALGIAAALGVATSHWLVRPISRLSQAAQGLALEATISEDFREEKLGHTVESPNIRELHLLAQAFNQMVQQLKYSFSNLAEVNDELEQRVAERTRALEQVNEELKHSTRIDDLTQVANRRRFSEYLETVWLQHLRNHQPLSLLVCDVDFFKVYNDTYGHLAGDTCLRQIARAMESALNRPSDLLARYGGEEFVVVLPQTNLQGAQQVAERIRQQLSQMEIPHRTSSVVSRVTVSIGASCCLASREVSPDTLIARADQALYQAKRSGRDQVVALPLTIMPVEESVDL